MQITELKGKLKLLYDRKTHFTRFLFDNILIHFHCQINIWTIELFFETYELSLKHMRVCGKLASELHHWLSTAHTSLTLYDTFNFSAHD